MPRGSEDRSALFRLVDAVVDSLQRLRSDSQQEVRAIHDRISKQAEKFDRKLDNQGGRISKAEGSIKEMQRKGELYDKAAASYGDAAASSRMLRLVLAGLVALAAGIGAFEFLRDYVSR